MVLDCLDYQDFLGIQGDLKDLVVQLTLVDQDSLLLQDTLYPVIPRDLHNHNHPY